MYIPAQTLTNFTPSRKFTTQSQIILHLPLNLSHTHILPPAPHILRIYDILSINTKRRRHPNAYRFCVYVTPQCVVFFWATTTTSTTSPMTPTPYPLSRQRLFTQLDILPFIIHEIHARAPSSKVVMVRWLMVWSSLSQCKWGGGGGWNGYMDETRPRLMIYAFGWSWSALGAHVSRVYFDATKCV